MNPKPGKLEIHYIKNNDFRTLFGSGVFGGVTPQGLVNVNFFTERAAIPSKVVYAVNGLEDPLQMTEIEREGKEGVIREVHFGVLMDINMAISFREWLDNKIQQIQQIQPAITASNP